jgi:hypothetical protein
MKDLTCPYCGNEQNVDDINETDCTHEVECEKCERIYGVTIEYYPSYFELKMPCANGEPHDMKKITRAPRVMNGCHEYSCRYCDHTENRPSECSNGCNLNKSTCWNCEKAK